MSAQRPVRAIGHVTDIDGARVAVGVDHGTVTLSAGAARLDAAQQRQFELAYAQAKAEAAAYDGSCNGFCGREDYLTGRDAWQVQGGAA